MNAGWRFLLVLGLLWALPARAVITCDVTATGVAFGAYNPVGGMNRDSTGTITFTCTRSGLLDLTTAVPYTIQLSPGNSGMYAVRRLGSGAGTLNYNLYRDPARVLVWGDGTGGSTTQSDTILFPLISLSSVTRSNNHTVYGRIFGGQNVAAGSYADSITVTVLF